MSSSVTYIGNKPSTGIRQSNETISQDIDGIYTVTLTYVGEFYAVSDYVKKLKSCPSFSDLIRTNWGAQRMDGNLGRATATFKGVNSGDNYWRYFVKASTNSNPIETHPHMVKGKTIPNGQSVITSNAYGYAFGRDVQDNPQGDPTSKKPDGSYNAQYKPDEYGQKKFSSFPLDAQYDLSGVKQYLGYSSVVSMIIVGHGSGSSYPSSPSNDLKTGGYIYKVGQISELPARLNINLRDFGIRSATSNHSWLITKAQLDVVGSAIRQEVDFMLSGPKGWNKLIYAENTKSLSISNADFHKAV